MYVKHVKCATCGSSDERNFPFATSIGVTICICMSRATSKITLVSDMGLKKKTLKTAEMSEISKTIEMNKTYKTTEISRKLKRKLKVWGTPHVKENAMVGLGGWGVIAELVTSLTVRNVRELLFEKKLGILTLLRFQVLKNHVQTKFSLTWSSVHCS